MTASPTTTCRAILSGISAYLDGDLDRAECDAIERHCHECPQCAELVQGLRETVGLCRQAALTPLPEAVRKRARDGVQRLLDRNEPRH